MSQPSPRVVVTGVGLVSPLGDSLDSLHEALCAGGRAHRVVEFDEGDLPPLTTVDLPAFDPREYLGAANFRPLDRTSRLAASAAHLALADSGWSREQRAETEVGLVLGTMFGSISTISGFDRRGLTAGPQYVKPFEFANSVINAAAGQTAIWHDLRGINATISAGTASGVQALGYAGDLIRNGHADVVLAGGAEEVCFESLCGFFRAGLLCRGDNGEPHRPVPFDRQRNGFAAAEAAAFLVLEEASAAEERGATIVAELCGFASGFDGSPDRGQGHLGKLIYRVLAAALEDAGLAAEQVDCVSASANGSPADLEEARGLGALGASPPTTAVKSMLGESLGASGALEAAALIAAMKDGRLPGVAGLERVDEGNDLDLSTEVRSVAGRRGLVHALGLDGVSCALVLEVR